MILSIYIVFKDYLPLGFLGSISTFMESNYNPVLPLIFPNSLSFRIATGLSPQRERNLSLYLLENK